jgi:hypothetical protein
MTTYTEMGAAIAEDIPAQLALILERSRELEELDMEAQARMSPDEQGQPERIEFAEDDVRQMEDTIGRIRERAIRSLTGEQADATAALRDVLAELRGMVALLQNGVVARD